MLIDNRKSELDDLLRKVAQELDVPPSKYEDAQNHYDAVGNWLGEKDSPLVSYSPIIYPQGSFALGTAIRPVGDDDYDVDAVCLLQLNTNQVTQKQLKDLVGNRLKDPKSRYRTMLDPASGGRRCWTIKYSDESHFHLDVLPALPDSVDWLLQLGVDEGFAKHAIRMTDTHTDEYATGWPNPSRISADHTRSNPKGYAGWFKGRMRVRLEEARRMMALSKKAEVEEIQDYEIRTPLQILIQLLKRHRDEQYNGDEDKPISVIITTLAAEAYNNEASIFDAMINVIPKMRTLIKKQGEVWWVANPVNPLENFADKWQETPRKKRIFYDWLDAVERDHQRLLTDQGFEKRGEYLAESYGGRFVNSALNGTGISTKAVVAAAPAILVPKKTQAAEKHQYQKVNVSSPASHGGSNVSTLLDILRIQVIELQERHPSFELIKDAGAFIARGDVSFCMEHDGNTIKDSYSVEILIPHSYPDTAPYARETGRRIPDDFHKLGSNCLCLGATIEVRKKFAEHKTLICFVEQLIVPYLFSYSYYREYGKMPFGERMHGAFGILDYYMESWGVSDLPALMLLKMLADGQVPMMALCPCASGKRLKNCHGSTLSGLQTHGSRQLFETELSSMIRQARAAGVEIPEQKVLPNRMLRNKRRNQRKKLKKKR